MQGSAPLCKCGRSAAWRTALAATPAKLGHVCAVKRARLATHCAASASRSPVVNAASVAAGWGPESWHSHALDVCGALPGVQEWYLMLLCVSRQLTSAQRQLSLRVCWPRRGARSGKRAGLARAAEFPATLLLPTVSSHNFPTPS